MSPLTWIPQKPGCAFGWKSSDGYYGISAGAGLAHGDFEAFHIEALWAKPLPIGVGSDLEVAKIICNEHRAKNAGPTLN